MSFLTNYSNIAVGIDAQPGNIVANRVVMPDVGNVFISDGIAGQLITTNGNGNLSWTDVANVVAGQGPAGVDFQIQYNKTVGGNSNVAATSAFTYTPQTKTLYVANTISAGNLTVNTITLPNIANLSITSASQQAGQALTSNGDGTVRFDFPVGSFMDVTTPTTNFNYRLSPVGILPAGTTSADIFTETDNPTDLAPGSQISMVNDPTWILTVTSLTPNFLGWKITWDVPLRFPVNTGTNFGSSVPINVSGVSTFSNVRVSGTITASVETDPTFGNVLTLTSTLPASQSQIIVTNDGTNATGTNNLTIPNVSTLTTSNVRTGGNLNVPSNVNVSGSVTLQTQRPTHPSAIISTASGTNLTISSNTTATVSNYTATGGYARGNRFAHYRVATPVSIPSNSWTNVPWTLIEDSSVILEPVTSAAGIIGWRNRTSERVLVLAAAQMAWERTGSTNNARRLCFTIGGRTDYTDTLYGLSTMPVNGSDFTIHSNSEVIPLSPSQYFTVAVYQQESSSVLIGGAYGGMTSGYSCRLNFFVMN